MKNGIGRALIVSLIVLSVSIVSCNGSTTQPDEPTSPPSPTDIPPMTEEPVEPATPEPDPTMPPDVPAVGFSSGPWWLIAATDGLWVANLDGTGLARAVDQVPYAPRDLSTAVSPQGGHVAFITAEDPNRFWLGMTLHLLTLPSGEVQTLTPIIAPEYLPEPDSMPGDPAFEAARAISELPSIAWSPDGQYLAFMGVLEGPTSDLYVYSVADGTITRLTDGPSQGIRPSWSPDGTYIVHAGVSTLGTGAGYGMEGIWAARADDTGVRSIYSIPTPSGDEVVVGWHSPTQVVVYTWSVICGPSNLRVVDVESGEVIILWEEFFSDVQVSDGGQGALLAVDRYIADCNTGGQAGVFIVRTDQGTPLRLVDSENSSIAWSSEAGAFFVRSESGLIWVSPVGEVRQINAPVQAIPVISSDGQVWGFGGGSRGFLEGVWVGPYNQTPQQVFADMAGFLALGPDGRAWGFFGTDGPYVGRDSSPELLAPDMNPATEGGFFLIMP